MSQSPVEERVKDAARAAYENDFITWASEEQLAMDMVTYSADLEYEEIDTVLEAIKDTKILEKAPQGMFAIRKFWEDEK